ncbi:CaiB/BaiF CoA transferase family protein [Janibacter terrae]|uniref:CaiB/BaiF CoA transferase family protein n=1 Tax=Janibacter terrae TaxID=103817 RepID=UPI001478E292|nr:CoA transferase [Janibacter terrae]MBA4084265.1 formyl-CoA transferase [Kytococcus sp.]
MYTLMQGVKVVEVASWTFVPAAGAVLADWGADVIKVEHPDRGDPQRGLISSGIVPGLTASADHLVELPNRGKRSVGIDIKTPEGRAVLDDLIREADVFLTNFLPATVAKLRLDVDDIRAINPSIIYARGTGQGVRGPEASRGGYDGASYFSRGGVYDSLMQPGAEMLPEQPSAFGDIMGGLTIAGGVAAALYQRAATGRPETVDVSLLNIAMWNVAPNVVASKLLEGVDVPVYGPDDRPNPIARNAYQTKDGRWIALVMLESDRFWPDFCTHIGRPDLIDDPRFVDATARKTNNRECIRILREQFATADMAQWRERLATMKGVWAPVQTPLETHDDVQVAANGYLRTVTTNTGHEFATVASPVQFGGEPTDLGPAPDLGQHTEEVLLELGKTWEDLITLKEGGHIS